MAQSPKDAVEEISEKIDAQLELPIAILFFSPIEMFEEFAGLIHEKYPNAQTIGSTTYINIVNNGYSKTGFSVLALLSDVEVATGVLLNVNRHPMKYVNEVTKAIESLSSAENTCCVEFTTAFSNGEELVLDTFNNAFKDTGIGLIGGSAGATFEQTETYVALNGQVYTNACAFMLIHNLKGKIYIFKENIYKPTSRYITASDVDCEERKVYGFNERPAVTVLKEVLDCDDENLMRQLSDHPLGRVVKDNIYITDAQSINSDGSITYLARIYNMTKMAVLEMDDIKEVWKRSAEACNKEMPNPSFSVVVNCCGRSATFEELDIMDDFNNTLSENYGTFATLSGFGEQQYGSNFNKTMVVAVFE